MCRVAYLPNIKIKKSVLVKFLATLEKSQGGDGNGIGYIKEGEGEIRISKGVNKSITEIVEEIARVRVKALNGFVFHTRLASSAKINYVNTHPHVGKNGLLFLVHNGHWSEYKNYPQFNEFEEEIVTIPVSYYPNFLYKLFKKKKIKMEKIKIKREKYSDSYVMTQVLETKIMSENNYDLETSADKASMWLYDTLSYDAVIFQLKTGLTYVVAKKPIEIGYIGNAVVVASQSLNLLNATNIEDFQGILKIYDGKRGEVKILKKEEHHYPYHYHYIWDDDDWLKDYYHYYEDNSYKNKKVDDLFKDYKEEEDDK